MAGDTPQKRAQIIVCDHSCVFTLAATTVEALGPEDFVRAYIADYESWNRFAFQVGAQDPRGSGSMAAAESAYGALLSKYCPPGHPHQPLAFGSDSLHDTARETIVSAERVADGCVVKTRHAKTVTFTADYEYHLLRADQRWFLTSNLYVDTDGKYECL